jgi:hypothetical protein
LSDLGVSLTARGLEAVEPRRLRITKWLNQGVDCRGNKEEAEEEAEEEVEEEALLPSWRVKCKVRYIALC